MANDVHRFDKIKIWEAYRATSAAFTSFKPVAVDGYLYRDDGLKSNNPVGHVYNEARQIWPARDVCVVSIGLGSVRQRPQTQNS